MTRNCLVALVWTASAIAQSSADKAVEILQKNCVTCHGAALKMSNLDLRTREAMLTGGEHGPALDPGNPEKSRLFRFVAGIENPSMPPGKKLADSDIAALRKWIEEGAAMPAAAAVETAATKSDDAAKAALAKMEERPILPEERQFWAFRPPVRPAVPSIGAKNPVAAFLRDAMRS